MKGKVFVAWMLISAVCAWGWRFIRHRELNRGFAPIVGQEMSVAELRCVLEELPTREVQAPKAKTWQGPKEVRTMHAGPADKPGSPANETHSPLDLSPEGPINVNGLDSSGWDALPWVGAWTARRIVRFRDALGGFVNLGQIRSIYHIHDSAVAMVERRGFIDTSLVETICVDTASWSTLVRHPYIDPELARIIERYRLQHELRFVNDLLASQAIEDSILRNVRPYLSVCGMSGEGF
jgi:DNA uptake protein ComE-like DNA-binding protein